MMPLLSDLCHSCASLCLSDEEPYPFYVSVARNTNYVSGLTKKLLAYFLGQHIEVDNSDNCKDNDDTNKVSKDVLMT